MILQNGDRQDVMIEVRELLSQYRNVASLPESLEKLVGDFVADPYIELIRHQPTLNQQK